MDRLEALDLLHTSVQTANILKHMLAAEAAMAALAKHLGEDEGLWALAGLLHDLDYEETKEEPARHGRVAAEKLAERGVPGEVIGAILAHNGHKEPERLIEKALLAVDPATGFIVACTLMHPEKKLSAVDVNFLMNRFKEKRFAAGASREQMGRCSELGLAVEDFLTICLGGMLGVAETLGL